jgi:hypothetical protein
LRDSVRVALRRFEKKMFADGQDRCLPTAKTTNANRTRVLAAPKTNSFVFKRFMVRFLSPFSKVREVGGRAKLAG